MEETIVLPISNFESTNFLKDVSVFSENPNSRAKLSGDEFFMMSISKIMVPLQSPGFLICVVEFAIVLVTHVKHLPLDNRKHYFYYITS